MKKNNILFWGIALIIIIYLSGCKKSPTACFKYSSESLTSGENIVVDEDITFSNCSEHSNTFLWDFGDGTQTSEKNPVHSYDETGSYVVKLTAYGEDKSEEDFTLETIDIKGPTSLTITVYKIGTTELFPSCEVYIFDNETDRYNLENEKGYGRTNSKGIITFDENLEPIKYYILAAYVVDDINFWYGEDETDELDIFENNEFTVYVDLYEWTTKSVGVNINKLLLKK